METQHMTPEEALAFFAEFYRGEHHIPGYKPKPWGHGFTVIHDRGDLATFDFNQLTQLVFMAHDKCIRVSIEGHSKHSVRISIWKRFGTEGNMCMRHPTIETALLKFNEAKNNV